MESYQTATGSWKHWVYVLWCLSLQKGVGIVSICRRRRCSTGNITGLLNWTFLFMIAASPLWIHEQQYGKQAQLPRGDNRKKWGIHYTVQASGNTQLLCAYCIIHWCKTWGVYEGITLRLQRKPCSHHGAARKIRKKRNLPDLTQLCPCKKEIKVKGHKQCHSWHM